MFNFFKSREELMGAIKDNAYSVPPVNPPQSNCHYTVGNDEYGNTVLKIGGDGYYTTTLTMPPDAVKHMIRMLSTSIMETKDD
jgi:hypothetical protein